MNTHNIVVSIVTPSYNQGKFIEETIQSVINQDYPYIEYLVYDACSTDNTLDIIKKYEYKISFWASEKDNGQSDAINKGWKKATGQLFFYLNSDDKLYDQTVVSKIVALYESHPEAAIFYGDCVKIDEKGVQIGYQKAKSANLKDLLYEKEFGSIMWQTASFYNAQLVRKTNYLNTDLHYAMDYELAARLANMSSLKAINTPIACFRVHKDQKSIKGVSPQNFETANIKLGFSIVAGLLHYFRAIKFELFLKLPSQLQKIIKPKLYKRYFG